MQQSDQLLLTSLSDFLSLPSTIQTLSHIKTQEIFSISLSFLQAMSIPIDDIKAIEKQKFRSTTKLNQKLHKQLDIELELNDLLNPTVGFVRKTLLVFLAKLGSNEGGNERGLGGGLGEEDGEKRKRKRQLAAWIDDQWVHPGLVAEQQKRPHYQAYLFPLSINRKSIKSNILPQLLASPSTRSNILPILATSLNHNLIKQKESQLNTGITKKRNQENSANLQTSKLIAGNFEDWNMAQQRLNKIRRKLEKDKENLEAAKKIEEQEKIKQMMEEKMKEDVPVAQSVFQAEVEEKIEEKQKQKESKSQLPTTVSTTYASSQTASNSSSLTPSQTFLQNPLQKLQKQSQQKKAHYQNLLQHLLQQLTHKKQQSSTLTEKKQTLESQISKDQQKLIEFKTKTDELKKEVEKKQLVLTAVQAPKEIQEEIKKFQDDIEAMEQQVKEEVTTTTTQIEQMKEKSDKKMEALKDLKIKLNRIEVEYKQVCQEIEQKTQRKTKIKINKSGISRNYYSKKISQIDKRWRQTQKQVQKIKRELEIAKEKTQIITNVSDSMQKEILSFMQSERNPKTEQQSKALKQVFMKCQSCFRTTLDTLSKINDVKEETRQYEVKVHALTSQNYKQGIEKVNAALVQLKKQIQEMGKKQVK